MWIFGLKFLFEFPEQDSVLIQFLCFTWMKVCGSFVPIMHQKCIVQYCKVVASYVNLTNLYIKWREKNWLNQLQKSEELF